MVGHRSSTVKCDANQTNPFQLIDINLVALISCILSVLNGVSVKNQMNVY
jgi:hypothetical protein